MDRIPVLSLGDVLLVSIQVDLQDESVLALQEDLADRIVDVGATGVVIDISAVEIVDSFIGRMFATIASLSKVLDAETVVAARLMGAECTISGIRPQIAQTIVALGIEFGDIPTKATLAAALLHALRNSGVEVVRRRRTGAG